MTPSAVGGRSVQGACDDADDLTDVAHELLERYEQGGRSCSPRRVRPPGGPRGRARRCAAGTGRRPDSGRRGRPAPGRRAPARSGGCGGPVDGLPDWPDTAAPRLRRELRCGPCWSPRPHAKTRSPGWRRASAPRARAARAHAAVGDLRAAVTALEDGRTMLADRLLRTEIRPASAAPDLGERYAASAAALSAARREAEASYESGSGSNR